MEQAQKPPGRCCQHCGTPLTDETAGGLCPRCLLEMNFASRTMPGGEPSPQLPPPTPEEMAARFPQFEILECLGRGGMGIVYKARQKSLDRLVAIKVLADGRHDEPEFAARFSREARTLAKMSHPNIVTVFDHGETDGLFYIVMEYVDGVNLRDLLGEGKIEPEQALAIVPPICEALEYAHDKGVVHRDIKPENLLLDRDGRVKIADFGIASLVGAAGEKSGTPPYMAPEQETGVVDRRADIYALGAVLYEMLTGERPDKDLVAPSKRVEIDVRLDEIVLRALEKEPARRYQTAGEFRTMVETMTAEGAKEKLEVESQESEDKVHFSRPAIVGACWAPLFFIALVPMFGVSSVTTGQSHGPAWWQYLLMFTLLPLGLAAPFGTTILGGVALTQIRRSAGRLYGLGLALFDVLLFPLLALDALIGGFWLLLFRVFANSSGSYLQPTPVNVLLATIVTAIIVDIMIVRRAWRAAHKPVGNEVLGGAAPETTDLRPRRMKFGLIIGVLIAAMTVLFFWAQQPRMIDERTIAADSPDGMFSAMGQTWHSMRILGGDRTLYRFIVQGRAGAVSERWDVPVPYGKLATSYVLLSRDEVLFGKHGEIVWSDDGKRVSFRVRGTEVSAYNTEDGGHSFQGGFLPQREVTLPAPAKTGTSFLDLDTGEVVVPSVTAVLNWHLGESQRIQMHPKICEWMRSSGVDLRMRAGIPGLTLLDGVSITMAESADPNADPRAFDTGAAAEVADSVTVVEQSLSEGPRAEPRLFGLESNRVHAVKTREGAIALVEILEESKLGPTRLRYKLVKPDTAAQAAYVGEWEWREGGGSDDFAVLILKNDGTAIVMEDGKDGETGTWDLTDDGITLTVGDTTIAGFLDPDGRLVLGKNQGAAKFIKRGKGPRTPPDATTGTSAGNAKQTDTPEDVARNFMTAFRDGDIDAAMKWISPEMKAHAQIRKVLEGLSKELKKAYAGKLDRLTIFTEWYPKSHDANTRFIGTRLAGLPADDGSDREHGLHLILSPTPEGWKVAHLDDASSDKPLSHYVDRIVRILPGEGPVFREQATGREPTELRRAETVGRAEPVAAPVAGKGPQVVRTTPAAFANDVDPSLESITVTFDRPMMDKSWSFTAGDEAFGAKTGSAFPQRDGEILYDASRTTCTMPVRLQPGTVYWVGINSPQHRDFKSADGTPARPYQILFATRAADGAPTPLPQELIRLATQVNAGDPRTPAADDPAAARRKSLLGKWYGQYVDSSYLPEDHYCIWEFRDDGKSAYTLGTYGEDGMIDPASARTAVYAYEIDDQGRLVLFIPGEKTKFCPFEIRNDTVYISVDEENDFVFTRQPRPEEYVQSRRASKARRDARGRPSVPAPVADEQTDAPAPDQREQAKAQARQYRKQLKHQQKPPMERAVDAFLESCARKGISDPKQLFDELGMAGFIEQFGDGERAMREHHDQLPEVMRFAISKATGEPSPAFFEYLRGVHRDGDPRIGKPAGLMLEMLGFAPANGGAPQHGGGKE